MDAAVPVDAKNARPPGTWKTVENAVSHSAHTHYCFRERMIENGESTSVAKPSTESDQAHSRPHVSNDNPFSEAQFKTLKSCPQFPERFGSLEDGRAFGQVFFPWYNQEHRHSGLGFLTPAVVHFGQAPTGRAQRQQVLAAAYAAHPERFVKGRSQPADLPRAVWINPPAKNTAAQDAPGTTIVIMDDLRVDQSRRRRRPCRRHDRRPPRDSNYCALGVSMSLTASVDRRRSANLSDDEVELLPIQI